MVDLLGPVPGLTPTKRTALADNFAITSLLGLLRHYPRRYIVNNEPSDLGDLRPDEYVTVLARISEVQVRQQRDRSGEVATVTMTDGRHSVDAVFFRRGRARYVPLPEVGDYGLFSGKVSSYRGQVQLAHPQYLALRGRESEESAIARFSGPIRPIYPATASWSSEKMRGLITTVLSACPELPDPLPADLRAEQELITWDAAVRTIHLPASLAEIEFAKARLRFDEAFAPQVVLAQQRFVARGAAARPRTRRREGLLEAFDAGLPYELTSAQRRVGDTLAAELASEHPMHRLLQGDVGSGKTLVALRAMLAVVDAGGQAALLAPTEVLAHQHWRTITGLLGPLAERGQLRFEDSAGPEGTSVALLTGSLPAAARREALLAIASGQAGIVIGTHALLQEKVTFADLALVVVDEQHRFGVEQRAALAAKAADDTRPHVLVMTATPIPRTIAMTVFGDLDTVVLDELPAGRASVTTHVVPEDNPKFVARVWQRVREEADAGRRSYVVCPRIDSGDDEAGGAAVVEVFERLVGSELAGLRVGMLHGRMTSDEKEAAMAAFASDGSDALDVLVCTTVVEVGLDVRRASVMVVLDAERFGVSQLHQLRGRVGRGSDPGLCLLVTSAPENSPPRLRLGAIADTTDGFALAQLDLMQRREGDVLGRAQTGQSRFTFLDVLNDESVISAAYDAAEGLVALDPSLSSHPVLAAFVEDMAARANYVTKN